MGLLTGAELVTEITAFLAGRDDLEEARILRSLNLVQEYIELVYEPNELEALATGTLVVDAPLLDWSALAAVPRRIKGFTLRTNDGRSRRVDGYSPNQFDAAFPEPDFWAHNLPMAYTKFATGLEFYPIPDMAYPYRMRFQRKCVPWTSENLATTPSLLEGRDLILVNYAVSHIYDSLGEYEKSARFYGVAKGKSEEIAKFDDAREPDRTISSERSALANHATTGRPWADPLVRQLR